VKLNQLIGKTLNLSGEVVITDELGPGIIKEWDSLGHVNLMSALENTYKITIEIGEVIAIETVADIKEILREKSVSGF
jgi:acyl carrier protein